MFRNAMPSGVAWRMAFTAAWRPTWCFVVALLGTGIVLGTIRLLSFAAGGGYAARVAVSRSSGTWPLRLCSA
jgi:hypothetical protein